MKIMKRNRRRRGFDEERKRQLRNNLRDYFISSKHLTYGNSQSNLGANIPQGDFSEAAFGSADHQLDPQGQLEKAKQANYNFGDIGITPESANQNGNPQQEQRSPQENQQETLNNEQQQEKRNNPIENHQKRNNKSIEEIELLEIKLIKKKNKNPTKKKIHLPILDIN